MSNVICNYLKLSRHVLEMCLVTFFKFRRAWMIDADGSCSNNYEENEVLYELIIWLNDYVSNKDINIQANLYTCFYIK